MNRNSKFKIAVFPGDGIGIEVMDAALRVLHAAQQRFGGFDIAGRYGMLFVEPRRGRREGLVSRGKSALEDDLIDNVTINGK